MDKPVVEKKKRGRKKKIKNPEDEKPKVPKKRGRKPKPKPLNPEPKPPPKKRGRKPKPKPEGPVVKPPPKRRGRKPKELSYSVLSNKPINIEKETDNIIIHLPIKSRDVKNNIKEEELLTYNPNLILPI